MARYIDADIIKFTEPLKVSRKDSRSLQKTVLNLALQYAKEAVDAIPDADVKPVVHAHWIDTYGHSLFECSACECEFSDSILLLDHTSEFPNYCPNCGAIMDEEV